MTRQTDPGWSLNGSPASIDASSITQTPDSGDRCLPRDSRTVWKVVSGMWRGSPSTGMPGKDADPRAPVRQLRRRTGRLPAMGHIVLLALGAAVFPALLAGVAIL